MIDQLRCKADEHTILVPSGDMATARAPGEYAVVYLVYDTIGNLLTQRAQVSCCRNAARHLRPGGRFVFELEVPGLRKLPPGQNAVVFDAQAGYIGLDTYDVVNQILFRTTSTSTLASGPGCSALRSATFGHPKWTSWRSRLDSSWKLGTQTGWGPTSSPSRLRMSRLSASRKALTAFSGVDQVLNNGSYL